MTDAVLTRSPEVSAAVRELDELADTLGMPNAECCSILGLSRSAYRSWFLGEVDASTVAAPELVRRINYALPLMRRMAANMPVAPIGRDRARSRPLAT